MCLPSRILSLSPYTTLFRSPLSSCELLHDQAVVTPNTPVEGAQGDAPCQAVGGQEAVEGVARPPELQAVPDEGNQRDIDRKSTRLNSSHRCISYAVFCLKKK